MIKKQVPNLVLLNVFAAGAGLMGVFWNLYLGEVTNAIGSFVMVLINIVFVLIASFVYRDKS